jgi:hypothetical protein
MSKSPLWREEKEREGEVGGKEGKAHSRRRSEASLEAHRSVEPLSRVRVSIVLPSSRLEALLKLPRVLDVLPIVVVPPSPVT